ncbi:MAG: GNAT family N-acetyltransferase [Crocinitomicaceae bacterium]|nr:GNAT family N-acetyltransferase [Crocinitomicaceae bacterium]
MSIEIRSPKTESEWNTYYSMRYEILRKPLNQPLGSERNDGDIEGIHFALYDNQVLRAIARLDQAEIGISQVRFVAVDTSLQGKGYGRKIMHAVEQHSRKSGNTKIILQARDNALAFYKKLDYQLIKKTHLLFGIVQHYLMEKEHKS